MPQVINTNIASLNAQRNLNASQGAANVALERLSSGLRINSAKDDAAGLAISERFQSQISGLNQAMRNANDGISLAQTAEGAMDEITNNLQRIRELSVQAANATNSISDRQALNQEVQQRVEEINRIASQTSFNGLKVLDGTFGVQTFQVGANTGETIGISGLDSRGSQLGAVVGQTVNFVTDTKPVPTSTDSIDFTNAMSGTVSINGTDVTITSAANLGALVTQINAGTLPTNFTAAAGTSGELVFINDTGDNISVSLDLTDGNTPEITFKQSLDAVGGGLDAFFKAGNTTKFDFVVNGTVFSAENTGSL